VAPGEAPDPTVVAGATPKVNSSYPLPNMELHHYPQDLWVALYFDQEMDMDSLQDALTIRYTTGGVEHSISSFDVSPSNPGSEVNFKFSPSTPVQWSPDTAYEVTLNTNATSKAGVAMAENHVFSFKIYPESAQITDWDPKVGNPPTDPDPNVHLVVKFDRPMDLNTFQDHVILRKGTDYYDVTSVTSTADGVKIATAQPWEEGGNYFFSLLPSDITDTDGTPLKVGKAWGYTYPVPQPAQAPAPPPPVCDGEGERLQGNECVCNSDAGYQAHGDHCAIPLKEVKVKIRVPYYDDAHSDCPLLFDFCDAQNNCNTQTFYARGGTDWPVGGREVTFNAYGAQDLVYPDSFHHMNVRGNGRCDDKVFVEGIEIGGTTDVWNNYLPIYRNPFLNRWIYKYEGEVCSMPVIGACNSYMAQADSPLYLNDVAYGLKAKTCAGGDAGSDSSKVYMWIPTKNNQDYPFSSLGWMNTYYSANRRPEGPYALPTGHGGIKNPVRNYQPDTKAAFVHLAHDGHDDFKKDQWDTYGVTLPGGKEGFGYAVNLFNGGSDTWGICEAKFYRIEPGKREWLDDQECYHRQNPQAVTLKTGRGPTGQFSMFSPDPGWMSMQTGGYCSHISSVDTP
ncbi:MAG: Ig-like domain-containing protein, partial [bacterium]|nr:Ig-like domain-containing protein [bacterium]